LVEPEILMKIPLVEPEILMKIPLVEPEILMKLKSTHQQDDVFLIFRI
jgi:hypothetical protein